MAWRLRSSVVRGEIDNRIKGRITGKVWLAGRDEPVVLNLDGNGYRDVAGCLFTFENPVPQVGDEHTDLFPEQVGAIGDYTASRKVRAFDIPIDEALAMIRRGEKPPEHMANCLYLEWFSERNGRVVIESYDYETKIVDTAWSLDEEGQDEQLQKNAESMVGFMQRLGEAIEEADEPLLDPEDDKPMDEFEWERFMKNIDKQALDFAASERDEIAPVGFDLEDPEPNPATEGIDWVRNGQGRPVHPLSLRATDTVEAFGRECSDAGLLKEGDGNDDLREMFFNGYLVGVNIGGVLDSLGCDGVVDAGFIVSNLKRAFPYFDKMMKALEKVRKKELIAPERLQRFSDDMFGIRAEIVQLMERFRNEF